MATNSITLDVILKDIVQTANDLKDTYVSNLKKVSESAFKKSAKRVINDMLEKKHTDMWKYGDDDRTKEQIEAVNKKIEEAVNVAFGSRSVKRTEAYGLVAPVELDRCFFAIRVNLSIASISLW